jgi:Xaa-Pro aminopeptidase
MSLTTESPAERVARARGLLDELKLDALLVSAIPDVRYLSGFRGDDTYLVLGRELALICTDSRYWPQVAEEVHDFALEKIERLTDDSLKALARELGDQAAVGFQGGDLSYAGHRRLRRLHRGRLRDIGDRLGRLRIVKDASEVAALRRACEVVEGALADVLAVGLVGRTEVEVAWDLRAAMHARGAEDLAFDTIVAAGERGALAHAIPGERRIRAGELVVIDAGARVGGYCSDITRTVAAGEVGAQEREIYDVVLRAQLAGLKAVRAGVGGRVIDAAPRGVIAAAGYGDLFGHGTGHGVGLEIHELPRLGHTVGDTLAAGMVHTVEPGIYLEGRFGVRIEDTVLVTDNGCERLTVSSKELLVVA